VFGKEGHDLLAVQNPIGNRPPPIIAELDLALIEPDIVPTIPQVCLDSADKVFVGIVSIAQEDPRRGKGLFRLNLAVLGTCPKLPHLRQRLAALMAL